eukprot:scaffold1.g5451.t1
MYTPFEVLLAVRFRRPEHKTEEIPAAVSWADVIILATPGSKHDADITQLAHSLGPGAAGKVLIDATNPFDRDLTVRWAGASAAEVLQSALPATDVHKSFNTTGVEHLAHPDGTRVTGQRLTMLFAGAPERQDVAARVIELVGFIPVYVGHIRYARHLEVLAELYVHLGCGEAGVDWSSHGHRPYHFQVLKKGLGQGGSAEQ